MNLPVFDSDSYFHKPTEPPFQEQYTPNERRVMLGSALAAQPSWILSGSVATWGVELLAPTHGVFLNPPREARLARLINRQRNQFGLRIESGGDMQEEHQSFLEWAAGYESRTGPGRNLETDRDFVKTHCRQFMSIAEDEDLDAIVCKVAGFVIDSLG